VSNHQTYFADVICFLHIFCAAKWGSYKLNYRCLITCSTLYKCFFCIGRRNNESQLISRLFTLAGLFMLSVHGKRRYKGLKLILRHQNQRALKAAGLSLFRKALPKLTLHDEGNSIVDQAN
jgi:hypothetical protein